MSAVNPVPASLPPGNPPLLSVITVTFNPGPSIVHAVKSVIGQDYPSIEHIIIDGGSSDGSLQAIRPLLRAGDTLVSEPDRGIYDAMNKGIARAKGQAIALLNADDRYANPGVASRFMEAFDDPAIDCVLGDVAFFRPSDPGRITRRYNSGAFRPDRLRWGIMPAHPAMILRRSAYDRVGDYRTDYQIAADYEFAVRAFVREGLVYRYIPEIFVMMAAGGVSTQGTRSRRIINRETVRACRENGVYTNLPMVASKYLRKVFELI